MTTIKVEAKSKFGVLNAVDGKWYNPDKSVSLDQFTVGKEYAVELRETTSKGRKFVNIVSVHPVVATAAPVSVAEKPSAPVSAKVAPSIPVAAPLNKDERILVQGITQAVLQSSLILKMDEVEPAVLKLVEMVKKLSGGK